MSSRRCAAYGVGIVALAYAVNAWFNHTASGLAAKSQEGAYVLGFFLPFGVAIPAAFLGRLVRGGLASSRALGVGVGRRDAVAGGVAVALGATLAAVPLGPLVQREGGPAEAHRLFAMLLVASIAETLVFLGALGNAVRLAAGGRWWSGVAALVAASLAFGFFHLTYPAPWNTVGVCLGLSLVWALVSLVFLVSRSLVAAIILNNIMAVIGFVENTVELSGTATIGWLQAAAALGLFALVFSLSVRRTP